MNAGISTITRGFVKKKITLLFFKLPETAVSSASQITPRRQLIRVHPGCMALSRGLPCSTRRGLSDFDEGLQRCVTVVLFYFWSLPRTCSKGQTSGACFGRCFELCSVPQDLRPVFHVGLLYT